ncbi:MAG: DUF5996 family protein [Bacteroidota bacterium]
MSNTSLTLPALPLEAWEDTKRTVHLYLQIVGKIRLKLAPRKNHWWYITLYVSPKGLTTGPVPYAEGVETFELTLNLRTHQLELLTSEGAFHTLPLGGGRTVAAFYHALTEVLGGLGIEAEILAEPFDMGVEEPFADLTAPAPYDPEAVERFWRVLLWVDGVLKEFSGRFYGKTSPVHLYWHHMDLVVTRFSGKRGPALDPAMRVSDKDAYSHEVISSGFWAGDENVRGAAFYTYAYPSPSGIDQEVIQPEAAQWVDSNGSPMAMLMYDDLRAHPDPRQALLDFLESTYQAGARRAMWPADELTCPPVDML